MDTREMLAWIKECTSGDSKLLSEEMHRPDLASVLPGDFDHLSSRQKEILKSSTRSFLNRDYVLSADGDARDSIADILSKLDQRMANAESGIRPKPCMLIGPPGLGKSTLVDTVIRTTHEATRGKLRVYELSANQLLDDPLYAPLNTKNFCALVRDWYEQPDMLSPQAIDYLREQTSNSPNSRGESLMSLSGQEYDALFAILGNHDEIPGLPRFQGDRTSPPDWEEHARRATQFSAQGFRQLSPLGAELLNPRPAYMTIVKIEEFLQFTPQQQDSALGLISAAGSSAETATNAVPFAEKDFLSGYQRRKAMSRQYNPCMSIYVTSNPDESMTGRIGSRMDYISIPPRYSLSAFREILARQIPMFLRKKGEEKAGNAPILLKIAEANPDDYYFKSNLARLSKENLDKVIEGVHLYASHILQVIASQSAELANVSTPGRFLPSIRESLEALPNSNNILARPCIDWFVSMNQKIFRPGVTTANLVGHDLLRACVGDDALNTDAGSKFWGNTFNAPLKTGKGFHQILAEGLAILTETRVKLALPDGKENIVAVTQTDQLSPAQKFVRTELMKKHEDTEWVNSLSPTESVMENIARALPEKIQLEYSCLVPLGRRPDRPQSLLLITPESEIQENIKHIIDSPMEFRIDTKVMESLSQKEIKEIARTCSALVFSTVLKGKHTKNEQNRHAYIPKDFSPNGDAIYDLVKLNEILDCKKRLPLISLDQMYGAICEGTGHPVGHPSDRDLSMKREGEKAPHQFMKIAPLVTFTGGESRSNGYEK